MIELFRPFIGQAEADAAARVIASGWIGMGPQVAEFERAFAAHLGVPPAHVVAVSCATEGLYQICALIAEELGRAGSVVMPANTFIGAASAVLETPGLKLRLCDVVRDSLNPTPLQLTQAADSGAAAVLVQHFGGAARDLPLIARLCQIDGLYLIEDCACAVATRVEGRAAGTFGNFGVWSFDAMKILTCGDGGLVYCRDAEHAAKIRRATRLGQSSLSGRDATGERWWEFEATLPGRRAIMNDLQAAIGLVQLGKLPQMVAVRRLLWGQYHTRLADAPGLLGTAPCTPAGVESSCYTYWIYHAQRDALARHLRAQGVYTTYRYWPVHYAHGWQHQRYPNAEWAAAHMLMLPLHPGLTAADVARICDLILEFQP